MYTKESIDLELSVKGILGKRAVRETDSIGPLKDGRTLPPHPPINPLSARLNASLSREGTCRRQKRESPSL